MAGKPTPFWIEHESILRELAGLGWTDKQIFESGKLPGKTLAAISVARARFCIAGGERSRATHLASPITITRVVSEKEDATVLAPDESGDEPFDELLGRAVKQTKRDREKAFARRFAIAKIVSTRPIGITFASDQHLTMHGPCDVEGAFRDAEIIQQTPRLYCMLGGDGVDNHIRHQSAMVGKASRPSDEYRLYDGYLKTLGRKTLVMISGNHDDWTKDMSGIDMVGMLAHRNNIHFAPDAMVVEVQILPAPDAEPTAVYTIKIRHQYRFNSSLNVGHAVKRMYDMDGDQFDVGVLCHNHEAHVESFNRHGLQRWALRPGAYQAESSWSRRIGFGLSYPTCPGVVLWPNERRIEAYDTLQGITEKLADLRASVAA